jgi:cellulose synthase/poly-beta-1,6-N-acetylglucosamine synthase-like glycosyltransferase
MEYIVSLIILIVFGKILTCIYYLIISKKQLLIFKKRQEETFIPSKKINILILIPVLREQRIILKTLEHFKELKIENINLIICIVGTIREEIEKEKFDYSCSTKEIVEDWIKKYNLSKEKGLYYHYSEEMDINGDRATQLNHGVEFIKKIFKIDIIGVYDADSLPNEGTLYEVVKYYEENKEITCQQPVHFIEAANRMSLQKVNPILIANALYQTTWTMIRELPRWVLHYRKENFKRNDYLIGHGEFISLEIYEKFKFPEKEITDGIQLGYRISMSNKKIVPLSLFCQDDVPQNLKQLILQHKRWFGGCMRLKSAYKWSKNDSTNNAIFQLLDGYWSQISWAYASLIIIYGIICSIELFFQKQFIFFYLLILLVFIYCYIIPYVAHKMLLPKIKIRFIDWLCLPIAILIKGIGPNLYILQFILSKVTKKKIKYSKVER